MSLLIGFSMKKFNQGILLSSLGSFWWGVIGVVYFRSLSFVGPEELVIHRCLWTTIFLLITSFFLFKFEKIKNVFKSKKKFLILGSAHNLKEIKIKEKQNVEKIFISSIFKKNKNFLGINKFKALSKLSKKGIIALGGISNDNINLINLTNSIGFAGISYFRKKKAPKKGPF